MHEKFENLKRLALTDPNSENLIKLGLACMRSEAQVKKDAQEKSLESEIEAIAENDLEEAPDYGYLQCLHNRVYTLYSRLEDREHDHYWRDYRDKVYKTASITLVGIDYTKTEDLSLKNKDILHTIWLRKLLCDVFYNYIRGVYENTFIMCNEHCCRSLFNLHDRSLIKISINPCTGEVHKTLVTTCSGERSIQIKTL